jgi:hypothetical protein
LASRFPNDVDYRWGVAMALSNLAEVVVQQDRPKEALSFIDEAGPMFDNLSKTLGTHAEFQQHTAKHARIRVAIWRQLDAKRP